MTNKKMISLEISDELREALRVEAFKKATTVSAVIRQILTASLVSNNEKQQDRKEN